MAYVSYSLAGGLDWDRVRIDNSSDEQTVERALRSNGLLDVPRDRNELVRVIHGIRAMARSNHEDLRWSDGAPVRFCFHLMFGEHLAPGASGSGPRNESHLAAIELATLTAESLALRSSGNLVIFTAREGLMDDLVVRALQQIRLSQPDESRKAAFIEAALALLDGVKLEQGLDAAAMARCTRNTPNAPIEAALRASRNTGVPVTAGELGRERARAVEELSEGTLEVLDGGEAGQADLRGRNIEVPMRVLRRIGEALRRGDPATPQSVILVGPPGTGKTILANLVAKTAGVAAFKMICPKGGIVGETERKVAVQQRLVVEWSPCVQWCDEIDGAMPLERGDVNLDSGATAAWSAALLGALSDERRRGQTLLIGATNRPWFSAAMRSRFEFIPVFSPLPNDYPGIIAAIVGRFHPDSVVDVRCEQVIEAGQIFYRKGAGPREMVKALTRTLGHRGRLDPSDILEAARDEIGAVDLRSVQYADLWALSVTSSRSYLPWNGAPASYPFPPHFREVVDSSTGEIRRHELEEAIERLKPHANV